jgi:hypothetical protein
MPENSRWDLIRRLKFKKCIGNTNHYKFQIDLIYSLTAIRFTAGGRSTVQYTFTHTQYTEQHNTTESLERNTDNNNNTKNITIKMGTHIIFYHYKL